jgi:hypothetical protein
MFSLSRNTETYYQKKYQNIKRSYQNVKKLLSELALFLEVLNTRAERKAAQPKSTSSTFTNGGPLPSLELTEMLCVRRPMDHTIVRRLFTPARMFIF